MGKRLKIHGQLSVSELEARYRQAQDGVGRSLYGGKTLSALSPSGQAA